MQVIFGRHSEDSDFFILFSKIFLWANQRVLNEKNNETTSNQNEFEQLPNDTACSPAHASSVILSSI